MQSPDAESRIQNIISVGAAYQPSRDTREILGSLFAIGMLGASIAAAIYATVTDRWTAATIGLVALTAHRRGVRRVRAVGAAAPRMAADALLGLAVCDHGRGLHVRRSDAFDASAAADDGAHVLLLGSPHARRDQPDAARPSSSRFRSTPATPTTRPPL